MQSTSLYALALAADARYSAACKAIGRTRWTLTKTEEQIPAIRDAYHAKVDADVRYGLSVADSRKTAPTARVFPLGVPCANPTCTRCYPPEVNCPIDDETGQRML